MRPRTRAAILAVLDEGESYGLEIMDRARQLGFWLTQSSLYPELRSMEREGLLVSWEGDPLPERGNRPRRYYRLLTPSAPAARSS